MTSDAGMPTDRAEPAEPALPVAPALPAEPALAAEPALPVAPTHHLAQLNIARLQAPLESEQLRGFVAALEPLNALADVAPGFVWRLQTEDGDATAIRPFPDDMMLVNMSVWESLESLAAFVYKSDHKNVMRQRNEWFDRPEVYIVLWWVPAGVVPTMEEAKARLDVLRAEGPSENAFTFRSPFPPPGAAAAAAAAADRVPDDWFCPT